MVFSASSTTSLLGESGDGAYYLKRTLLYGAVGLLALRVLSIRGVRIVRPLTGLFLGGHLLFLLVAVMIPGIGVEVNGAKRWIGAGLVQIQPSELAKVALILYGAHLLATPPADDPHDRRHGALPHRGRPDLPARGPGAGPRNRDGRLLLVRRRCLSRPGPGCATWRCSAARSRS